jgi:hypothetical protein
MLIILAYLYTYGGPPPRAA